MSATATSRIGAAELDGVERASILVVDDRPNNVIALSALLEPLGRRVVVANSGTEALRRLLDESFAVVLLDVQMPGMDGFETARYIRARPSTRATPIIFVTAISTASEHIFRGYEEGAVDYILKPIDPSILRSKVSVFVELYETNAVLRRQTEMQAVQDSLSLAQRAGGSGMWDIDLRTSRVSWSPEYAELCGLPASGGDRADAWLATVDPRDRPDVEARLRQVLLHGASWDEDFRINHPTRGVRWIASRGKVFRGSSGAAERFTGIAVDITERRRDEDRLELLQRATAALSAAVTAGEVAQAVADFASQIVGAGSVVVATRDDTGAMVIDGASGRTAPDSAIDLDRLLLESLDSGRPAVVRANGEARLVLPLISTGRRQTVVGVVADGPDAAQIEISLELLTLVSLGGEALQRALLYHTEQEARERQSLLADLGAALDRRTTASDLVAAIPEVLVPRLADACLIQVVMDDRDAPRLAVAATSDEAEALVREIGSPGEQTTGETPTVSDRQGTSSRLVVPIRSANGPIGSISLLLLGGRRFSDDDAALAEEIGRRSGLAFENARLSELHGHVASTLQHSLLPDRLPGLPAIELAARYLAAGENLQAGGDWFEAVEVGPGRVTVAVGDVVGRGTEAAAIMGQLRSAARAYALQGLGPAEILEHLDRFARGVPGAAVSTVVCAEVDTERGQVRYACAGHPPPLLVSPNGMARYLSDGRHAPLGVASQTWRAGSTSFRPGESLVLFTDGAVERRSESIDRGFERLARLVSAHAPDTADAIAAALIASLAGEDHACDDVALLVARYEPPCSPFVLSLRPEAHHLAQVRRRVREWLSAGRVGASLQDAITVSVCEACANAIEHSGTASESDSIRVTIAMDSARIEIRVDDEGQWLESAPSPTNRGRGITIMKALMDAVAIERGNSGTSITMRVAKDVRETEIVRSPSPRPAMTVAEQPFDVLLARSAFGVTARVSGDIDAAAVTEIERRIGTEVRAGRLHAMDLSRATHFGSAAASLLFEAAAATTARGETLTVIAPGQSISRQVLAVAGFEAVGTMVDAEPDALERLGAS